MTPAMPKTNSPTPRLELRRRIDVTAIRFAGTIASEQTRRDCQALAQHAIDLGGATTPEDVSKDLFAGRLDRGVAERFLRAASELRLFREDGGKFELTDDGRSAAETAHVLVPERGAYSVWIGTDPLLPASMRVLRVEEFREPTAFDDKRNRRTFVEPAPGLREALSSFVGRPPFSSRPPLRFLLDDRLRVERFTASGQVDLILRGSMEAPVTRVAIRGNLGPDPGLGVPQQQGATTVDALELGEGPPFETLWRGTLGDGWDTRRSAVLVSFDELKSQGDAEIRSHRRNSKHSAIEIKPWGVFQVGEVTDAPLAARTLDDARAWARWHLEDELVEHLFPDAYEALVERALSRFPKERSKIRVPDQESLAKELRRPGPEAQPRMYWFVQAALDLVPGAEVSS